MQGLSDAERARLQAWAERWDLTPAGAWHAHMGDPALLEAAPRRSSRSAHLSEHDYEMIVGGLLTALLALSLLFGALAGWKPRHGYNAADSDYQSSDAITGPIRQLPEDP